MVVDKTVRTSKNTILSVADLDASAKALCYSCVNHLQRINLFTLY